MNELTLVLIRGIPGSGKSTLARRFAAAGFKHFEADHFFYRQGRYVFDPELRPQAHALCQNNANAALESGESVVIANTFVTLAEIKPYQDMAKRHGARFIVLVASGCWPNIHDVPAYQIENMIRRWQPLRAQKTINALHLSSLSIDAMLERCSERVEG